jgi:hypothetical protein
MPAQPNLFATCDALPEKADAGGFWLLARDEACTAGEITREGWAIRFTCSACRRTRELRPEEVPGLSRDTTMAELARRAVCGDPACGSHRGVLTVLRPAHRRRGHVTDRDLERIRAMAEQVTPEYRPPVLDDLDAPVRVGAFMPGDEAHEGGTVFGAWAGRVLVGWRIPQAAKNARRKRGN